VKHASYSFTTLMEVDAKLQRETEINYAETCKRIATIHSTEVDTYSWQKTLDVVEGQYSRRTVVYPGEENKGALVRQPITSCFGFFTQNCHHLSASTYLSHFLLSHII